MNQVVTLLLGISMSLVGADVLIRRESGLLNPDTARTRFGQLMVLILGAIWLATGVAFLVAPFLPLMDRNEIEGFAAIIATVEFTAVFLGWLSVWAAQKIAPLLLRRLLANRWARLSPTYQRLQQVYHLGYGLGQVIASHHYEGQEVVSVRFGHDIHVVPAESIHLASEADTLRAEADARVKGWMVETVKIRSVRQEDLPQLLSYGWISPYDQVIQRAYDRSLAGEIIFLVAEADAQIIGQVWVDLTQLAEERAGFIQALFVVPTVENLGLGTRLLEQAEETMREQHLSAAEVSIEKRNRKAKRLYARLGYEIVDEQVKAWTRTTSNGRVDHSAQQSWNMRKEH